MRRLRSGFTLIELLVVVAIIALLISILLPALSEAKKRAQEVVCASNVRQLGLAMRHYLDDNNGFYPADHVQAELDSYITWAPRIRKYIGGDTSLFWCPATDVGVRWQKRYERRRPPRRDLRFYGYEPGETPLEGREFFNYGYNGWGVHWFTDITRGEKQLGLGGHCEDIGADWAELKETRVKRPEDMIAIADSFTDLVWDTWVTPQNGQPRSYPSKRHRGGSEVLFADGHALNMHFDELLGLRNKGSRNRSDVAMRRWNNDYQPHEEYWDWWP